MVPPLPVQKRLLHLSERSPLSSGRQARGSGTVAHIAGKGASTVPFAHRAAHRYKLPESLGFPRDCERRTRAKTAGIRLRRGRIIPVGGKLQCRNQRQTRYSRCIRGGNWKARRFPGPPWQLDQANPNFKREQIANAIPKEFLDALLEVIAYSIEQILAEVLARCVAGAVEQATRPLAEEIALLRIAFENDWRSDPARTRALRTKKRG